MEKIGRMVIHKNRNGGKPAKCVNCGGKGRFLVIFKDHWGKLTVTLCKECAGKEYGELKLQSKLKWPGVA